MSLSSTRAVLSASLAALLSVTAGAARADEPETEVKAQSDDVSQIGVGARLRFVFLPTSVLNLFLGHSTPMSSVSFGADVIRRKGNFDIDFGLEYANISPADGLYSSKGDNPSQAGQYPDYTEFKGLALLSVDASFIWHTKLHDYVQLRYGAGIGVGFVLGDIHQTKTTCPSTTTMSDIDNPAFCTQDTTQTKITDKPPVVPIVNLLIGLRIKLIDKLTLNVEAGFRDVFFAGGGIGYFF